jgi:hypothetical protein
MHFEYRGFEIECATAAGGADFIGTLRIWQAPPEYEDLKVFTSDSPGRFLRNCKQWTVHVCGQRCDVTSGRHRNGRPIMQRYNVRQPIIPL